MELCAFRSLSDASTRPLSKKRGIFLCATPIALSLIVLTAWLLLPEITPQAVATTKESFVSRAERAFQRGDFGACEELLKVQLRDDPKNASALALLAQVYRKTGRIEDSCKLLLTLARSGSLSDEDLRAAIRTLTELAPLGTNNFHALKALALCCEKSGDFLRALDSAHRALALVPGDSDLITVMTACAEQAANPSSQGPQRHPRPGRNPMNARR